jgi:uncharacterized DUF497 family protein
LFVAGFDWDEGNRDKYSKHGVSHAEIEAVFAKDPLTKRDFALLGNQLRGGQSL